MNRLLLLSLLLAPCSLLRAQFVGPGGPYIREVKAGAGVTVTTNGYSRVIAAPGGAGDITGGAVTGGILTVAESAGILTYGLTTNAVRSAVSGLYLPLSGGTVSGNILIAYDGLSTSQKLQFNDGASTGQIFYDNGVLWFQGSSFPNTIWHSGNDGTGSALDADTLDGQHGSYYTNPDNLTSGTVPDSVTAAKYRQPVIAWSYRDLTLQTTAGVGWTGYEILAGSRRFGLDAISAAAADDQLATLRSDWQPVPAAFGAFKSSEALRVTWVVNSAAGVTEIRGIRLTGKSALTGTETILYTDTTTRDVVSSGVPVAVSIARSSFASTTVPAYIAVDVDFSVEDGEKAAVVAVEALSE